MGIYQVSIKSLTAELAEVKRDLASHREAVSEQRQRRQAAEAEVKETREQFADLKKRLHIAETEVARLNGYIARVREDDTVREELVTVGDPEGDRRMVPKRKHEYLGNSEPNLTQFADSAGCYNGYRDRPKSKHWVEY